MRARNCLCAAALAAVCCGAFAQAPPPPVPSTPAQEAGKLYTAAMSQYSAGQYKQALPLLEKFLAAYPTHDYAPVAWLQLAACRSALKDAAGCDQALDEVIGRFHGSPAWYCAYGAKLSVLKGKKDNDGYLALLETMLQKAEETPFRLHGAIGRYWGDYWNYEYAQPLFEPTAHKLGGVIDSPGWVIDIVEMADKPERAERALRLLGKTFQERAKDLPTDWQYAHVALLRQAEKVEEAEKALKSYLAEWGDDPRAIALWLLEIKAAQARKDERGVDAAYEHLFKTYPGAGSLEEPTYQRLAGLHAQDRYDQFGELARQFFKTYPTSIWYDYVMSLQAAMAQRLAEKGDGSRVPSAMAMLDEFTGKHPYRQFAATVRKIELLVATKKYEDAARLAPALVDEKHWSAQNFDLAGRYAALDPGFAKVLDAAREKWKIPLPNPTGRAFVLLNNLKLRLKDDQVRHAEEIGEEMFAKYRDDASTIEAVKLLADYYFSKVLPEPRDKWMARMVQAYPAHPLTQAVLTNQITTEQAAQRSEALAAALDTTMRNFPGTAGNETWFVWRCNLYDQAKDPGGKLNFAKQFYGDRAEAGEIKALGELTRYEEAPLGQEYSALGDLWMTKASKYAGTRTQLYCHLRAWSWYYAHPYYYAYGQNKVNWTQAQAVSELLRKQEYDSELRWKLAFADVNLLAQQGDGAAALKALNARLKDATTFRDLGLRLDFSALGSALGKAGLGNDAVALSKRLAKICVTSRDEACIQLMLAGAHAAAKDLAAAGADYLKIVDDSRTPARMYYIFNSAASCLRQAGSPKCPAEMERYMKKTARVQELVPGMMFTLGEYYVQTRNPAAIQTHRNLVNRYPASPFRDRLDELLAKLPR